ncbi:type II toxin-antitoxin system VapC family toxin [Granulicoccus phenolivorans]|uniref:type II toxin-antitoxin system VapC family toxin n=1 Tax=Granulicoccus phenolivorans TaxID=266854 RepID=UPI00041F27A3|nr:type II toxin-antitoxin system VapC family toxin [Granulicoccus phenolivorans]
MTGLLVDTSVLIKWFHSDGESELAEARAIRDAHVRGVVDAYVLDLALYEVGNVLTRALGWQAVEVAAQLDDLVAIVGPPLVMSQGWLHQAARIAETHGLSFYDASWAAAAAALKIPLVSADRRLVTAGLAETPTVVATRLHLTAT